VQNFTVFILSQFQDHRIKAIAYPTYGYILFRNVRTLIEPIRSREQLLGLFEPDTTTRIRPETLALSGIEAESHLI
jgi:hypothetical protein